MSISSAQLSRLFLLIVILLSLFILFAFNGTGLEADSFHHHLIARYAPIHPFLYFDHWAKPLYTLISSPFAQFGFIGSKIFNILCSIGSMYFCFLILKKMRVSLAAWVIPCFFIIPLNFQITFSAFTEAFFALVLVMGIYSSFLRKYFLSALLISFLPLIRSEGLIFLGIFALYFLIQKEFWAIFTLTIGQLIYSLFGYLFLGKSILWLFTEIPYASLDSPYGNGKILHFTEQMFYILGPILCILFVIGLLLSFSNLKKRSKEYHVLILLSFFAFFTFHSLSWYLGWFNSMGLKRVFGAVTPLIAIIIVVGLENTIGRLLNKRVKLISCSFISLLAAALLFSSGPAGIDWEKEMNLSRPQLMANEVAKYIEERDLKKDRILFSDRYLAEGLQIDLYNSKEFEILNRAALENLQSKDLIIWDNWHSPTDFGIELSQLKANPQLTKIKEFEAMVGNRKVQYILFSFSKI